MKILKEFQTAFVKVSLLAEHISHNEGFVFYVREIGMTDKNEHDSLQKFQTKEEAEAEYQRLQELLRDNGNAIMETFYNNECPVIF